MPEARVQLLGMARVQTGSQTFPFQPTYPDQLSAYLAYRARWVSRERVAYLFWPDREGKVARRNLRRLLGRARVRAWGGGLEASPHSLRWAVVSDVADFTAAFEAARWEEALSIYRGPLLAGLEGTYANEYLSWLEAERSQLRAKWRVALLKRAEELSGRGQYLEASALLEPVLGDDLDERVLHTYMKTVTLAGGRERALQAYAAFARRLCDGLSLTPTAELEQLAQAIREGAEHPGLSAAITVSTTATSLSTLPTPATSFVGRDLELAEVADLLARPECQLVTLTGAGGVGKTRIALQSALHLSPQYRDGVAFVALEAVASPALIPSAVAAALGLPLSGPGTSLEQLVCLIGAKRLLLVLDSFEHLLAGATQVQSLAQACPKLAVLVTSRERLDVDAEWLMPVEGLPYPRAEAPDLDDGRYYDAVRLFEQRAKRVRPDFSLSRQNLAPMLSICRQLDGLPLGLELAAAWVRLMPLAAIDREIRQNLDFLGRAGRAGEQRHRSVRVVFEHSWARLTPREQALFGELSVFAGGFGKEAALRVAGASLPALAGLVDKSLLRVSHSGRYERHALIHRFSREKLALEPPEKRRAEARHGRYYLRLVREQAPRLYTAAHKAALGLLAEEHANISAAWRWAVRETESAELAQSALPLSQVFATRNLEAADLYASAVDRLDAAKPEQQAALGYALACQAKHLHHAGAQLGRVAALAERALALLKPRGESLGVAHCLATQLAVCWSLGDFARARALTNEGLALARRCESAELTGAFLLSRGLVHREHDAFGRVRGFYERALVELRALGHLLNVAKGQSMFGYYLVQHRQFRDGERLLAEAVRLLRALDDKTHLPHALAELALASHHLGDPGAAERFAGEAFQLARATGNKQAEVVALACLGRVATARGDYPAAEARLLQSLHFTWTTQLVIGSLALLTYLAEWSAAQGQIERAVSWLSLVLSHPSTEKVDRVEAQWVFDGLARRLAPPELAAAAALGRRLSLGDVVARLLVRSPAPLTADEPESS